MVFTSTPTTLTCPPYPPTPTTPTTHTPPTHKGTFINGQRMPLRSQAWLQDGDRVSLVLSVSPMAEQCFVYRQGDPGEGGGPVIGGPLGAGVGPEAMVVRRVSNRLSSRGRGSVGGGGGMAVHAAAAVASLGGDNSQCVCVLFVVVVCCVHM